MAADEIERFRRDIVERTGDARAADSITDQDLLREVMNTVGKKDQLGGRHPLRRVGVDAHRRMGRQHRDAHPWHSRLRHAAPVRAGDRPRASPAVYELNERRPVQRRVRRRLRRAVRLHGQAGRRAAQPPRETVQVKAVRPERDAAGDPLPARGGLPRRVARRAAHGDLHRRLKS